MEGEYRVAFLLETLEHVGDPSRFYESKMEFLDGVFGLLQPRGRVVISVPKMVGISFLVQRATLRLLGMHREEIGRRNLFNAVVRRNTDALEPRLDELRPSWLQPPQAETPPEGEFSAGDQQQRGLYPGLRGRQGLGFSACSRGAADCRASCGSYLGKKALEPVDAALPAVIGRRFEAGLHQPSAQLWIAQQARKCRLTESGSASAIRQFSLVPAEVAVAVGVGADDRRAGGHRLEQRQAEALVHRGLHEDGRLVEELVDLARRSGARSSARRARRRARARRRTATARAAARAARVQASIVSGRFLSGSCGRSPAARRRALGRSRGRKLSTVDPRRNELGWRPSSASRSTVPARDRRCSGTPAGSWRARVLRRRVDSG